LGEGTLHTDPKTGTLSAKKIPPAVREIASGTAGDQTEAGEMK
jgi:hypothetical protein